MRLGEMLVRDGRLTHDQLEQALAHQARDGGRLGTVLFELGFVDLEALTVYLGLELGIPIATGAMLERAKRAAVRVLQPAQAFKHKCLPLVIQDRQLIAAIEDPHDLANLESLTQLTGYRVLPRVAPEVRIYYYIERYYGVARPARFMSFGDRPRGNEQLGQSGLPAPPLPGLPPVPSAPVTAPGPAPRLRSAKVALMFDESEDLELEAEDLLETLDADDDAPAEAAPQVRPHRMTAPPVDGGDDSRKPVPVDDALSALSAVTDRNGIVEVLLSYAAGTFGAAVLFTVRDHLALGWKAVGAFPGREHVEHLLLPLAAPSILQAAVASETGVYHGPVTPSTVNTHLYKVLGCAEPRVATAAVIAIGQRAVNVLYGHDGGLSPAQIEDLQRICGGAAEAYARLIAVKKQK